MDLSGRQRNLSVPHMAGEQLLDTGLQPAEKALSAVDISAVLSPRLPGKRTFSTPLVDVPSVYARRMSPISAQPEVAIDTGDAARVSRLVDSLCSPSLRLPSQQRSVTLATSGLLSPRYHLGPGFGLRRAGSLCDNLQDLDINLNISGAGSPLSPLSLQGTRPSTPDAKGRKTSSGRTGLMQSLAHAERSLADRREPAVPDALASVAASSTTGDATATTAAAPSLGPKSQTASAGGVQAGVSRQNSAPGMVVPKSSIFGYDDDDLAGTKHTIRLRRGSTPKAVRQPRKGGAGMFLE